MPSLETPLDTLPETGRTEAQPYDGPRIGYVLKMYPRFSETFILNEVLALEAAGAQLAIFSLRPPADGRFHEALAEVRAPVTYLPFRLKGRELWDVLARHRSALPRLGASLEELLEAPVDDAVAAVELAGQVVARGITHLHAHFASVATTVARLAARLAGVTYSFTAHAKDIFHEEVDDAELAVKLRDAAFVVTVSDFNLDHLRERFGTDAARVVRLYNGLDLARFAFEDRPRAPFVAAVGRLVEKKGFTHLLDAVALLRESGREVPVAVVGTGAEEAPLRAQAGRLGLDDLVTFHGPLPQGRVRALVADAAVFAAPCVVGADGNRDGLPTVLLEAMALGTPVVSTPVTGIPEVVHADRTGLLVPEADPAALASAIARLLDDPGRGRRLARQARVLVEDGFDVHRNAAELLDLFAAGTGAARPLEEVAV